MKDLKSNTDPWKELLKDKVNQYAADSQPDWSAFSHKLQKPVSGPSSLSFSKSVLYGLSIIATIASISYFAFFNGNESGDNIASSESVRPAMDIKNTAELSPSQLNTSAILSDNDDKNEIQTAERKVVNQIQSVPSAKPEVANAEEVAKRTDDRNSVKPNDLNQAVATNKVTNNLPIVPDARFSFSVNQPCSPMVVNCIPNELSDSVFYLWTSSEGHVSTEATCSFTFSNAGQHWISLSVNYYRSTEKASFTEEEGLFCYPRPSSDFTVENQKNAYEFRPRVGTHLKYSWEIADLKFENTRDLEYSFVQSGTYPVLLKIRSEEGCYSETRKEIKVEVLHPVFVGNAFTPDGDGINDYFGPKSEAIGEYEYQMEIYNRYGSIIFRTNSAAVLWDGSIFGNEPASEGFYHYKITTRDHSGNSQTKTGEVYLIRKK